MLEGWERFDQNPHVTRWLRPADGAIVYEAASGGYRATYLQAAEGLSGKGAPIVRDEVTWLPGEWATFGEVVTALDETIAQSD